MGNQASTAQGNISPDVAAKFAERDTKAEYFRRMSNTANPFETMEQMGDVAKYSRRGSLSQMAAQMVRQSSTDANK